MPDQPSFAAQVSIGGPAPDAPALNRLLFGKFTEHLGRNVYGGAWAQLVENPEFAPATAWPDRAVLLRRLQAAGREHGLPALSASLAQDLPPWWQTDGTAACRLEVRRTQPVLSLDGATSADASIRTPLYLPTHRERRYVLRLWLRADVPVRVSLWQAATPWATVKLAASPRLCMQEAVLEGADAPPPGTSFQLVIAPEGWGRAELRRCLLFPADHLDGWDPEVVAHMRAARLPLLRFPGGNFVSAYHWRDGVGPAEDRPVLPNPAWPEAEWNHVGTDEWLHLCELVGAEPLICVNAGTGSPEEAADWVEYCNSAATSPLGALRALNGHPAPYGVRLWEVGNELYGNWQAGATDAAGYAARYGAYARTMALRDPKVQLIANGDTEEWNRTVVFGSDEPVLTLSHHALYDGFPEGADPRTVYLEHMAFPAAYRRKWDALTEALHEAGRARRLAITEMQVFTHRPSLPTNATVMEAVWDASILHEAIRAGEIITLVTHSALVNHGGGLRKERGVVYPQPCWWVTHLYGSAPDDLLLCPADIQSPSFTAEHAYRLPIAPDVPWLDVIGLATPDGSTVVIFLVNRHPDSACQVALKLPGAGGEMEVQTLAGDSYMAHNSWDRPDAVAPRIDRRPWPAGVEELHVPPAGLVRCILTNGG